MLASNATGTRKKSPWKLNASDYVQGKLTHALYKSGMDSPILSTQSREKAEIFTTIILKIHSTWFQTVASFSCDGEAAVNALTQAENITFVFPSLHVCSMRKRRLNSIKRNEKRKRCSPSNNSNTSLNFHSFFSFSSGTFFSHSLPLQRFFLPLMADKMRKKETFRMRKQLGTIFFIQRCRALCMCFGLSSFLFFIANRGRMCISLLVLFYVNLSSRSRSVVVKMYIKKSHIKLVFRNGGAITNDHNNRHRECDCKGNMKGIFKWMVSSIETGCSTCLALLLRRMRCAYF